MRRLSAIHSSKLRESLPSCPNYPKNQGSTGIRDASDRAQNLLTSRRELLQSLTMNKEGEMILRGKVQGDKTALNVKVGQERRVRCRRSCLKRCSPLSETVRQFGIIWSSRPR